MEDIKVDVAVMTYNSEKYLEQCLSSIEKTVPINRLIVVDHYSTDSTIDIAKRHRAEICYENVSLGYARQLAIERVSTPIFAFVDSDVVFMDEWFWTAWQTLTKNSHVGAVVAIPHMGNTGNMKHSSPQAKYSTFWVEHTPAKVGFLPCSALVKKEALQGIRIPPELGAREDTYMQSYMLKRGYKIKHIICKAIHYSEYSETRVEWLGANARRLGKPGVLALARKILAGWMKAFPPAIVYHDANIIAWNTKHWLKYLKGWCSPQKYWKMKR